MKIVHFKQHMRLEDGGVVKAVLDLCTMSQDTDQVGLITFEPSGVPAQWLEPDTTTTRVHQLTGKPRRGMMMNAHHRKQFREIIEQYDVVHLHSAWSLSNPQAVRICKEANKPYVVSPHGMIDDWCMQQGRFKKIMYLKTWGRNLFRDANRVHCTAQGEFDQASAWFDPSKGQIVSLPFDLGEYADVPSADMAYNAFDQLDRDLPKVLFLSRLHYKKGIDRLIKASGILSQRGIKHQLVIAGTGDEPYVQEMKDLAQAQGITDHAYFLGFASGREKVALFGACDVFALPTSQENFGFVFFESLAAGTTVLTTKGTATWKDIERSGGGIIVDNTPEAFADALETIIADLDGHNQRAQQARDWAFREISMEKVRAGYKSMYQACIDEVEAGK